MAENEVVQEEAPKKTFGCKVETTCGEEPKSPRFVSDGVYSYEDEKTEK